MIQQDQFNRIITALHDAALDDTVWSSASRLIDEAVGMAGSHMTVLSGHTRADVALLFGDYYEHGELNGLGRLWATTYFSHDERIPRALRLPDSRMVHVPDLYTARELKTSPTYNELLRWSGGRNGLGLRMDGPDGSHIAWGLTDSLDPNGWGSTQLTLIERLLPHIRQFVRVRQALAAADALNTTLTRLLDNVQIGVLYLDRYGRIVETNARGLRILQRGDSIIGPGRAAYTPASRPTTPPFSGSWHTPCLAGGSPSPAGP